jgi:hypothetical protein
VNALVPQNVQLPAHLQQFAQSRVNDKVGAIALAQPPSISLRQSRFWLIDGQGNEQAVMTPFLDVVIIDMNKSISKIFYEGTYDPSDTSPPTCFSDNGVGASSRATVPQHNSCQLCPQNQWGSKISQMSQKPIKACTDVKKLAVVLASQTQTWANNVNGIVPPAQQVYMLRVPAASLKAFGAYADSTSKHNVDLAWLVTRLQFDPNAGYPSLLFSSTGYITAELAPHILPLLQPDKAEERRSLTGESDVPWQGTPAQLAPPVNPLGAPPAHLQAPQPPVQQPGFALPTSTQVVGGAGLNVAPFVPALTPAPPAAPPPTPTATAAPPPPVGSAAPTPRKRGRPPATPAATAAPSPAPEGQNPPAPAAGFVPPPAAPPQQQVVMNAPPPPADLSALLGQALGIQPGAVPPT